MPAKALRTIAVVAVVCCSDGAFAVASSAPRQAPVVQGSTVAYRSDVLKARPRAAGVKHKAARTMAADRNSHVDPAAPYKVNRLSSPRVTEPILNIPGQTTVLTREVLDDMKATSLRDAMRSTAGVTVGR